MGSARKQGGSKHLSFYQKNISGRKMPDYIVSNAQFREEIGVVHWRGGWRQYVFQAYPEIDMSRSCMKELIIFIDKMMKDWRESKK